VLVRQKSESGHGDSLIFGTSSMQGWRISMEDAHACLLDLQASTDGAKATEPDKRLAFFGVYDGHGGDKVAIYTGERLHQIVAKQEAFKTGDLKKALQDGFLATDRAILSGRRPVASFRLLMHPADSLHRPQVRRGGLWMYRLGRHPVKRQDLLRMYPHAHSPTHRLPKQANAGDSRTVLGVKGRAKPLSFDHKPQNEGANFARYL
jgi:protein phosphatase 2C family protein 2/3